MSRFRFLPAALGIAIGVLAGSCIGYGVHKLISGGAGGAIPTHSGAGGPTVSHN